MKYILTILIILSPFFSHAQSANPFKSLGKKGEIITLSKGRYQESFDDDVLQQVGTVIIDRRTKKIVELLNTDTINDTVSDKNAISRWYSVDPHAGNYVNISPYTYVANNPLRLIDPDGADIIDRWIIGTPFEPVFKVVRNLKNMDKIFSPFLKGNIENYTLYYKQSTDPTSGGLTFWDQSSNRLRTSAHTDYNKTTGDGILNSGYIMSFSEIGMAQTVIHEGIHAFILNQIGNGTTKVNKKDREEHNYMADNYRPLILDALKEYNTNHKLGISDEGLEALSWVGLENTEAYKTTFADPIALDKQNKLAGKLMYSFKVPETQPQKQTQTPSTDEKNKSL